MKHILRTAIFSLSLFSISFFANGQACTPNNDTVSGIEPDTLAIAFVNTPYEEIIYFRLPADTVVEFINGPDTFLLPICIDSLTIDSVQGLPEGFSYSCNVPWCSVLGGGNGCASISGITQSTGIYPLNVFVTIYVNDCDSIPFALPAQVDTITFYYIDVQEPSGMADFAIENVFSLGKIFPNPTMSDVTIPFYLPASGSISIAVLDLEGRICFEKSLEGKQGFNIEMLDVSLLNEGAYFVQLKNDGNNLYSRIQVLKN
ncbi:MAG TPA: T9SS type A sorting domain-containing protein [Chitinophagales bacterium]|nr:T9SS type A sorting domain-containing protein [Chitinophagales bacterium]